MTSEQERAEVHFSTRLHLETKFTSPDWLKKVTEKAEMNRTKRTFRYVVKIKHDDDFRTFLADFAASLTQLEFPTSMRL